MAKKQDSEIDEQLTQLAQDFERNEQRMRKAATEYQDLIAEKESILSSMKALRKSRSEAGAQPISPVRPGIGQRVKPIVF